MKNTFYIIFSILILLFSSCGKTTDEALDYNDNLIGDETAVMNLITTLEETMTTLNPTKIELVMNDAKKQLKISKLSLEEMGGFDGDNNFKNATMDLYNLFDSQLNNEYKLQYEICKNNVGKISDKDLQSLGTLQQQIDQSYNLVFGRFLSAQKKFADKWKFKVVKVD